MTTTAGGRASVRPPRRLAGNNSMCVWWRCSVAIAAAVVALLGAAVSVSWAHGGNPRFVSVVRQLSPATRGVAVEVLNRDDRLLLVNRSGKDVVIDGYGKEPYARLQADQTVEVNTNSPAYYLNDDRYAAVKVPAFAKPSARPRWKQVTKTGRFEWHDHRIHWMAKTTPPQVHDKNAKTKIFDWSIPVQIAGAPGRIAGTLYWTPLPGANGPGGTFFGFTAIVIVLCIASIVIARRRRHAPSSASGPTQAW